MDNKENHGILYKTSVYLCGAMQFTEDGESWRDLVSKRLNKMNVRIFNPYKKPFVDKEFLEGTSDQEQMKQWQEQGRLDLISEKMKLVRASDLALCDKADYGIFYLNPKIATIGTIEELTTMNRAKRPCFVLWDSDTPCYWLLGMLPPKYIYRNWEGLLNTLEGIDSGKIETDSKRWKLLREEYR